MSKIFIICKFCPETPILFYEKKNSLTILHFKCLNEHKFSEDIDNLENLKKECGKCNCIIEQFNFSLYNKCYLCKSCYEKCEIKDNLLNNYSNFESINQSNQNYLEQLINESENYLSQLLKFSQLKFYKIYQYLISDLSVLYNQKYYNQNLVKNIVNFKKIDFKRLLSIDDNYQIIFQNEIPEILFSSFFNFEFRDYYEEDLNEFSNILKLINLYEYYGIDANKKDNKKFHKFITKSFEKLSSNCEKQLKKLNDKLIEVEINEKFIQNDLKFGYLDYRDYVKDIFYINETIPSIFVLKRKLIKAIIDFIHSIKYKDLPLASPNYKLLFRFFNRLYEAKDKIKENNIKEKIENILYIIKEKLFELIKIDKKKVEKYDINENDEIKTFTDSEIKLIKEKCSEIEKEKIETECEYFETNHDIIHLKFILSFFKYMNEKSNDLIHILLEKRSQYFVSEERIQQSQKTLNDYIKNLFKNEKISDEISGQKLIEMFFFELNFFQKKTNILIELDYFLDNNDIQLNNGEIFDYSSNINEINNYLEYLEKTRITYQTIINQEQYVKYLDNSYIEINKNLLGMKRERKDENRNQYIDYIIQELFKFLQNLENTILKCGTIKENIIIKLKKINEMKLKIEKIKIIIKEIKEFPMETFSISELFNDWKKYERKKIERNCKGNILEVVTQEMNNFSLKNLEDNLKSYIKEANDKTFYFYEEEGDIWTNLFLYQNQIPPNLCKLIYKYIK